MKGHLQGFPPMIPGSFFAHGFLQIFQPMLNDHGRVSLNRPDVSRCAPSRLSVAFHAQKCAGDGWRTSRWPSRCSVESGNHPKWSWLSVYRSPGPWVSASALTCLYCHTSTESLEGYHYRSFVYMCVINVEKSELTRWLHVGWFGCLLSLVLLVLSESLHFIIYESQKYDNIEGTSLDSNYCLCQNHNSHVIMSSVWPVDIAAMWCNQEWSIIYMVNFPKNARLRVSFVCLQESIGKQTCPILSCTAVEVIATSQFRIAFGWDISGLSIAYGSLW